MAGSPADGGRVAQVLKEEVRARILEAAGEAFAEDGFKRASMARIAKAAKTATANLYRYFPDKASLFDAVVPAETVRRHDEVLEARLGALGGHDAAELATAEELLDLWVAHRWAVIVLLDRAEDTRFAGYPAHFVDRLVEQGERAIGRPATPPQARVMRIVFDNTRRALAEILRTSDDPDTLRELVRGFWSYQLPGLEGLAAWMRDG